MKIKTAGAAYLDQVKNLTQEASERLQSRMRGKLARRLEDKSLDTDEALAIQLELDDLQLEEWREKMREINAREEKKKLKQTKLAKSE